MQNSLSQNCPDLVHLRNLCRTHVLHVPLFAIFYGKLVATYSKSRSILSPIWTSNLLCYLSLAQSSDVSFTIQFAFPLDALADSIVRGFELERFLF